MDWLVSSLENCPPAKLPLWILITQIYWKDLLKYRKYGRRLAGALLEHFSEACSTSSTIDPTNTNLTIVGQSC